MFLRPSRLFLWPGLALSILASMLAAAAPPKAQSARLPAGSSGAASTRPAIPDSRDLFINDIGAGAVPVDGNWQFHLGDDPAWASPELAGSGLDDSGWEPIRTEDPWGVQGH